MPILGRFHDGRVAEVHGVELHYLAEYETGSLLINAATDHHELARWPAADLYVVPGRRDELRLACSSASAGARVVVQGAENVARIRATLPVLQSKQRREAGRQTRLAVIATLALASVIAAYLYGVPLLANRLVGLVPTDWEQPMPSRCPAGRYSSSRPCSNRRSSPMNSPAYWPMRLATSPIATAWSS